MNGMQMMLASMGIDVKGIEKIINPETVKTLLSDLENVTRKLDAIQSSLIRIENKLNILPFDEAMKPLIDAQEEAEKEAIEYVRNNTDRSSDN